MMQKHVLLILPALLVVFGVGVIPTICLINYSVQTPFSEQNIFVGFENFKKLLFDYRFLNALQRNVIFSIICVAIEIPLGIVLAKILYEKSKLNTIISIIITVPVLIPPITIGLLWRLMIVEAGPLRRLFTIFNIPFNPYRNPTQAFCTLIAVDIWHWTPLVCLVVSAGLAGMDKSPVLSARTEGATGWQIFRYIELPAIKFPLIFMVLLILIDTLKLYDEAVIIFGGGPGLTTEFLSLYTKRMAIDQFTVGFGAALSLVYNLIVLVLCVMMMNVITKGRGLM